jgi:hypothetical protein
LTGKPRQILIEVERQFPAEFEGARENSAKCCRRGVAGDPSVVMFDIHSKNPTRYRGRLTNAVLTLFLCRPSDIEVFFHPETVARLGSAVRTVAARDFADNAGGSETEMDTVEAARVWSLHG